MENKEIQEIQAEPNCPITNYSSTTGATIVSSIIVLCITAIIITMIRS